MSVSKTIKITAEAHSGRGYIRITDVIGTYSETGSAAVVRAAVDSFIAQGISAISAYISCAGGSVFEATDIKHELDRVGRDNVTLHLGALGASAVTYLIAHYHTTADAGTKIMIHKPEASIYGNIDVVTSKHKLLSDLTDDYRNAYINKTGMSAQQIDELWSKGEVWLTAQQALDMKLIDAIGKPINTPQAVHDAMVTACLVSGAEESPEEQTTKSNTEMDKLKIIAALGLAADATDEQILTAAQAAKTDADRLAIISAQAKERNKERGIAIVAKAILDKKITADVKAHYQAWAIEDPDKVEAVINAMAPVPQLSKVPDTPGAQPENRKDWSYAKWQDEDPEGLEKLYNESPEAFEKLQNASIQ